MLAASGRARPASEVMLHSGPCETGVDRGFWSGCHGGGTHYPVASDPPAQSQVHPTFCLGPHVSALSGQCCAGKCNNQLSGGGGQRCGVVFPSFWGVRMPSAANSKLST